MTTHHTPVLIVGGSIVGASAALFLAARGVRPVLVERHPTVSTRLRAKLFYPRTMEAYRAVGADRDVYALERRLPPADHAAIVRSLAGPAVRTWRLPAAADFSAVSPCPSAFVKQADLEEIVRAHARTAGADLRLGHRFVELTQDGDRVVARLLDAGGEPYTVTADYLLAADGNGSAIRESLGIGRAGPEAVQHVMEIRFAADLRRILDGRRVAMAWTDPDRSFLSWNTAHDGGALSVNHDPATATSFTAERCRRLVGNALGLPAEQVTITGTRPWQMGGWVADSYRAGRVFLAGDAAHVTPPVGGFGANTGIQDAWNLAAKLVSVLRGDAAPALLDDYEPERRSVGELTVRQSLLRIRDRAPDVIEDGEPLSEAAVAIGYRYPTPTEPDLPAADEPARWHGEPGTRLPHVVLPDGRSTLDLVRDGRYLLLTGHAWERAAHRFAALDVVSLPSAMSMGTLLVRPDHVIAWRATHLPPDADATLTAALRRALGGLTRT